MESLIRLQNARKAFIHSCRTAGKSRIFARVEGKETAQIRIADDNLADADKLISYGDKVKIDDVPR